MSNSFERMSKMLKESDEVQDKGACVEVSDRIAVELSELKKMLQEDMMIEELT